MAYLNVKIQEPGRKFNWDEIECGNNSLDHSQNFFAQKHFNHERREEFEDMELVHKQMNSFKLEDDILPEDEDKENIVSGPNNKTSFKKEISTKDEEGDKNSQTPNLDSTFRPPKPINNIACQWSTQKRIKPGGVTGIARHNPQPPHAYEFKDLYQRKKDEAIRKRLEEERKKREFHSRPMPNYDAQRGQLERRKIHAITVAVTPMVLKKSKEVEEQRKRKMEEWKRQHQPPKFESRPPTVLKEAPFIPKKTVTAVQQCPFNLHSERRLQERKQYDAAMHRSMEEKKKQEERERKNREEEHIKELRKMATFKARPNPFKQNRNNI